MRQTTGPSIKHMVANQSEFPVWRKHSEKDYNPYKASTGRDLIPWKDSKMRKTHADDIYETAKKNSSVLTHVK
jgi:hypothetical protein